MGEDVALVDFYEFVEDEGEEEGDEVRGFGAHNCGKSRFLVLS